jgi:hypothetical protein
MGQTSTAKSATTPWAYPKFSSADAEGEHASHPKTQRVETAGGKGTNRVPILGLIKEIRQKSRHTAKQNITMPQLIKTMHY